MSLVRNVLFSLILNALKQNNRYHAFVSTSCSNYNSIFLRTFYKRMSSDSVIRESELTVHSAHIDDVYEMPIDQIIRPLPSVLDECKVDSLMKTLQVIIFHHFIS